MCARVARAARVVFTHRGGEERSEKLEVRRRNISLFSAYASVLSLCELIIAMLCVNMNYFKINIGRSVGKVHSVNLFFSTNSSRKKKFKQL